MNVEVLNDSVLHVSWEPSISPNGVITEYRVTVTNLIGNVRYEHEVQSDQLELIISNGFGIYTHDLLHQCIHESKIIILV